jgi:predicted TIM-barrel fold metal-dependent hydrolase
LVFGGILDRHPRLQIVFAEASISWIPGALQDAEMMLDTFDTLIAPSPKLRPTDYWQRNCFATFMSDPIGLKLIDYIGGGRILWSQDYPHNEGTLGYTRASIREIVDAVKPSVARNILGGTAIELFDLPRKR